MRTDMITARSDERYAQLLDTAPDAMIVVEPDGRISLVNLQAERMFGYERAELLGQPLELLVPLPARAAHAAHLASFFRAPNARAMGTGLELTGQRKDGTLVPIEVSLSPLVTSDGVVVSAAIRDITERRRILHELREARLLAEAGSAAKTEFLASMSHELRTPLNAILGFAQLLERDQKALLDERQRGRVEQIIRGGEHLLRLIDDILDLSKIEAGGVSISLEPVSVREVVDEVWRTLSPLASRAGVTLETPEVPGDLAMIVADRTRYQQILVNLGSNAIKYNRPGGWVRLRAERTGPRVRTTVIDNGFGIAEEKHSLLFQPFQRAGQEAGPIEGTGIGLVITRRLAELMKGAVGVASTSGVGSRFWVELPAHAQTAPVGAPMTPIARPRPEEGVALAKGRHLVLYVEDNPANVAFMRDFVSSYTALDLVSVPTAELGIELAHVHRPELTIMDINLPGMSGLDALAVLKTDPDTRQIPVIALTAAASQRDRQRGLDAGFFRYLTKPVNVDELAAALSALKLS